MFENLKHLRTRRGALGIASASLAVVGSLAFSGVAGATGTYTVTQNGPANHIVVGSGSSTTYNMMQALDTLYNSAPGCTTVVDFASGASTTVGSVTATPAQPLDFSCLSSDVATVGHNLNAVLVNPTTGAIISAPTGVPVVNPFNDAIVEESPIGSSIGIFQLEAGGGNAGSIVKKWAPSQNLTFNDPVKGSYTTSSSTGTNVPLVDFARSSRFPATATVGGQSACSSGCSDAQGLTFVAYAKDGVTWSHYGVVNGKPSNSDIGGTPNWPSVTTSAQTGMLTMTELDAIYTGKITNWAQVGGANAPIIVFSAQEGSGTQSTWKTFVGNNTDDPSKLGTTVNCATDRSALLFNAAQTLSATNCAGPIDVFENETGSISLASLPTQLSTPTTATANSTGSSAAAAQVTMPQACTDWIWGCTKSGGTAKISATTYQQTWTLNAATADAVKSDAIFFYSVGLFNHQCQEAVSVNKKNTAASCAVGNYALDSAGKYVWQLGEIGGSATAGSNSFPADAQSNCSVISATVSTNPCLPNQASILSGEFAVVRNVFNVYANGADTNFPTAQPQALAYMSESGFLCSDRTVGQIDPVTGVSYRSEINSTISAAGFYPISGAAATGGVNTTAIDEGAVDAHTAASIATGTPYQNYTTYNTFGTTSDPSGFCLVSNTDSAGNSSF